ncbi:hypothetical protein MMC11_008540 [Xylographa trunciseda]|nr:hypothetical protein [Xylographa trunciseda]
MGKRTTFPDEVFVSHPNKRPKVENGPLNADGKVIQSPEDLQKLLAFRQDATPALRQNIQTFKGFLDSIMYEDDSSGRSERLSILFDYLQSTLPRAGEASSIPLADIIQTWSFAAQSNHEGLLSAVPAVLALLLKAISSSIDFRECGVQLCQALLGKEQIRLFDRGLTANKSKERLISPCLRLLTEITSFDGGSTAHKVYQQRDVTFKRLDIFLSMGYQSQSSVKGDKPRPSVRSNALQYVLSNLRFQDHTTKEDILSQLKLVRAVFHSISEDPSVIILDILDSLKKFVVLDSLIGRKYKSRLFSEWNLSQIARLYDYQEAAGIQKSGPTVADVVHDFLLFVCTTIDRGVMLEQNDWYPPGTEVPAKDTYNDPLLLIVEQSDTQEKFTNTVPVRNTTLASFMQGLRPYANSYHRELALAIFRNAPELVADYFFKKKTFLFEPKLSATWIGYSAFLFSSVQLPIPRKIYDWPPPVSIVLENILPQPLNQKVLTRCINQRAEIVTFFAVRLLTAAFQKMERLLALWTARKQEIWTKASSHLLEGFCRRCPELKHVIMASRSISEIHIMLREALLRLMAMYYKITPQLALNEKFDISTMLVDALNQVHQTQGGIMNNSMQSLELDHLLEIARRSPEMSWWHKPDKIPLSPFTSVLRLHISLDSTRANPIRSLLQSLIKEYSILQLETSILSFNALVASLTELAEWKASDALYAFLDNCVLRLVRKPIHYRGELEKLAESLSAGTVNQNTKISISLLFVAILEQWSFLSEAVGSSEFANAAEWLSRYFEYSIYIGENVTILQNIKSRISEISSVKLHDFVQESTVGESLPKGLPKELRYLQKEEDTRVPHQNKTVSKGSGQTPVASSKIVLSHLSPPEERENHPGLGRWTNKTVLDAVEDGAVEDLLLCLCSKYEEIRKQALISIRVLASKLEASEYVEWQQLYLLLEEVAESAKPIITNKQFPSVAGVIATRAVKVLDDPLHFMYIKVNKFLNKSPNWEIDKLPSYWVDKVFLHPPSDDDTHHYEVQWVVDTLIDGLRTAEDMELYRRCNIFERLLSFTASPTLAPNILENILHLFYRCSFVEGSSTLITRCGLVSWIQTRSKYGGPLQELLETLAQRVYETSDTIRMSEWSDGCIARLVENTLETTEPSSPVHHYEPLSFTRTASPAKPIDFSPTLCIPSGSKRTIVIIDKMSRKYSAAELMRLRESPLVCKPASLPSTEEWMGPPQEQNQRKPAMNRAKTEDPAAYSEISGPRPSLYETRHMSRGSNTVPSEIILGPPKTAFASASSARNPPKTFDSPHRTTFGSYNGDSTRSDLYNSKEKSSREGGKLEMEDHKLREPRSGAGLGRIATREEVDTWSGLRSSKNLSIDESDRPYRRNGDNSKGENGEGRRPQRGFENHRRDMKGESDELGTPKRTSNGRGTRPSWYRDDDPAESQPLESSKDTTKRGDWRDNDRSTRRGGERDWNRGGKVEQDPEWMLEPDMEDKKQARTAEDIEQWKASMKAAKNGIDNAAPSRLGATKNDAVSTPGLKLDTPLGLDSSFDKFFGLWHEPLTGNAVSTGQSRDEHLRADTGRANPPKSSRFTGFFSPKPELPLQETTPPAPVPPASIEANSSNEDKEGFQRILQMLGGGNVLQSPALQSPMRQPPISNGPSGQPPNTQQLKNFRDDTSRPLRHTKTPPTLQPIITASASPPILSPRSRRSITVENLLGPNSQSSRDAPLPQNSESEFLLSLMRPKGAESKQPMHMKQRASITNGPGILPHPNLMNQQMNLSHQSHLPSEPTTQHTYYDTTTTENIEHRDKLNPNAPLRTQRGSVPNSFHDFSDPLEQPLSARQNQFPPTSAFALPTGVQRPPGFDHLHQGYPPTLQSQRPGMVAPPPGFLSQQNQHPNLVRNPNHFPPGLLPNLGNLNISPERSGIPFAMRPMLPGPGGQPPPPGFAPMNGPQPPGFPALQDEAGRMMFGGGVPRGMEMFGEMGGFGNGGASGAAGGAAGRGGFGR